MTRFQVSLLLTTLAGATPIGCDGGAEDDGEGSATSGTDSTAGTGTAGTSSAGTSSTSGSGTGDSTTSAGTASTSTSGGSTSASSTTDPSGTGTEGGSTSESDSGGGEGGGTIDLTLTGCSVDLGGTVVVSYNGSLGVASVYDNGATLTGSLQFDLEGTGAIALSSQHRVDTGEVVNLVDIGQGTWTNLDSDALAGGVDRIGGTLTVNTWDPASGVSDIEFDGVSLLHVSNGNVCTIDGTIVTTELYP